MADGDAVYIDSGTTTLRIAELLTARNVNALTNGIAVAAALAEKPTVRHTLVGGVLRPSAGAVAGRSPSRTSRGSRSARRSSASRA